MIEKRIAVGNGRPSGSSIFFLLDRMRSDRYASASHSKCPASSTSSIWYSVPSNFFMSSFVTPDPYWITAPEGNVWFSRDWFQRAKYGGRSHQSRARNRISRSRSRSVLRISRHLNSG